MLHIGPPPVVRPPVVARVVRSAVVAVVRDYFRAAKPGMRLLGARFGRFSALAAGAVVLVVGLTLPGGLAVQSALAGVPTLADAGVSPAVRAATVRTAAVVPAAEAFQVHVQSPTSLLAGSSRQFRIAVIDRRTAGAPEGDAHFMRVEVELQSQMAAVGLVTVAPSQVVASASSLGYVAFRVTLSDGVMCETDLGEMLVRVVDAGGARGETLVTLPPVDCRPDLRAPSVFDRLRK